MKNVVLWLVVIVLVVAGGGILLYGSTAPGADVVPEGTPTLQDESSPNSQFLQLEPDSAPLGADERTEAAVEDATGAAGAAGENAGTSAGGEAVTMSLNDTGYTPQNLTIAAGTTVTFVNNGQGTRWPASDVHPTHQILPAFDAKRSMATGEEYSHTFTEAGTWNYHDHLRPSITGTITVE